MTSPAAIAVARFLALPPVLANHLAAAGGAVQSTYDLLSWLVAAFMSGSCCCSCYVSKAKYCLLQLCWHTLLLSRLVLLAPPICLANAAVDFAAFAPDAL
jgi:hypothetical protein